MISGGVEYEIVVGVFYHGFCGVAFLRAHS